LGILNLFSKGAASPTPYFSPVQGSFAGPFQILILDADNNAPIYYTVDGTVPTVKSPWYNGKYITVSSSVTIKAIAVSQGKTPSAVATAVYTVLNASPAVPPPLPPSYSPAAGTYTAAGVTVVLAVGNAQTIAHYTTDGSTPTVASPGYAGPIVCMKTTTIKAIAVQPGFPVSAVATALYTVAAVVPAPSPTPVPVPVPVPVPSPAPAGATFVEIFTNLNAWTVSNWAAFGGGQFLAANVDVSTGMLRIKLTSNGPGSLAASTGGEVECNTLMGYGRYDAVMRASSTSPTPTGAGVTQSGQISACFNYLDPNSTTEIDGPEIEGQYPTKLEWTNWKTTSAKQATSTVAGFNPQDGFHTYSFIWAAGSITYLVDNVVVSTHTQNIPTAPANFMFNHWPTDSVDFGGVATAGVRYMFVKSFTFTKA